MYSAKDKTPTLEQCRLRPSIRKQIYITVPNSDKSAIME